MPFEIFELDPEVEDVSVSRRSFIVTINDTKTLHVTVTSDAGQIQEWLNMAIKSYEGHIVSIHIEPRPFKSIYVPPYFQPTIRSLFIAIGRRVLVIHFRNSCDLPGFSDELSDLYNGDFYFLAKHMPSISRWLIKRGCVPTYSESVRGLAAIKTGREELWTAGLKKIVQDVMGLAPDPWLSRRLKGWSSESLSPELVMQGSIWAYMAFEVAQTCRQVPVAGDRRCYVVTIDDANILRVTVTSDAVRIQEWLNIAIDSYHGQLVGIHAEPRLLKSKHVHRSLQPSIRALFVAIGPRVLVVQLRSAKDLPQTFVDLLLLFDQFHFVGMDMERIARWLNESKYIMKNISEVRELAADHTRRVELRTAGLKKIVQAVMGLALDPILSRRFWLKRWSSKNLSPELVMQGSIRVFMAFQVAQAIRDHPQPEHQQQGSSSGS
ncbi:hypothetical protein J5N97_007167 [Dioscorea zingiberensis]|uniref:Uncharacterized protein n=1 Tax=Dioscorea zingiberensis TaxID=325984 RepID=A0A9D5DBF1_9LILI|nr:hypothetical protein J5N97_007167 [Dioscorea zingiberensis]